MASTDILQPIHRTYQRRGYLSKLGYAQLDAVLRQQCWLYNHALAMRKKVYALTEGTVSVSLYEQYGWLTGLRHTEKGMVEEVAVAVHRGTLKRLAKAYDGFFRRIKAGQTPGHPRFKPYHRWHTIELAEVTPGMVKLRGNGNAEVRIKGLPTIAVKQGGGLPDATQLKSLRITRKGRRVTVNLTYVEEAPVLPACDSVCGIDMGVSDRMALSDGTALERRTRDRDGMAAKQRRLARCRKGSREWRKRKAILSNAQGRVRIRNRNACHRITTAIVRQYGHIAVEDLQITNMTASAAGTVEEPGTNVRAKAGLNREIMTQTWGMLREQLRYKASWAGREYVVVSARNTSQRCSVCGVVDPANRTGKAYLCGGCGYRGDADTNAARNIAARAFGGWEFPAAAPLSSIEAA